jgi:hypothetical protein
MKVLSKREVICHLVKSNAFAFWTSGILGIIFFLIIFGWSVLDVSNVDWLIGKEDISQHYFGWCFYRNGD